MTQLFNSFSLRDVTFRNRIGISPMCQYSCVDGMPSDWHLVHLGSRAVGGAGAVIVEATAVEPIGRISPADAGLWNDQQAAAWGRIARFMADQGAVPGVQIAHAGRKASTAAPWEGRGGLTPAEGGWQTVGPSAINFKEDYIEPIALNVEQIRSVRDKFAHAARRAIENGFQFVEIHAAHGYLIHSFLSPLSNTRTDAYGGSFENRTRLLMEVATAVRAAVPDRLPVWTRLSCTDWVEGGWTLDETVEAARKLKAIGIDLIDCSSGGNIPKAPIPNTPGYQLPFATRVRHQAGIATAAVGLITDSTQANAIIENEEADMVLIARQSLRDPYFPLRASRQLGQADALPPPRQYARAID